jgi:hypothetical protein
MSDTLSSLPFAALATAVEQLLTLVRNYPPFFPPSCCPRAEDWDRVSAAHSRVVGLARVCGWSLPPPMQDSGLVVYASGAPHPAGVLDVYAMVRRPDPAARERWLRALEELQAEAATAAAVTTDPPPTVGRAAGARGQATRKGRKMSAADANEEAKRLVAAGQLDPNAVSKVWADAIGCSTGLVTRLPLWREMMKQTGRGRRDGTSTPQVVSLTSRVEAVAGQGDRNEVLEQLIAEQKSDDEGSPLDDGSRKKVRVRKRL